MNNNIRQCNSCGRSFPINTCPAQCDCGVSFRDYDYTLPACIRNKKPECAKKAIIASTTVETTDKMEGIRDAFVHVAENNTTYYLDSCGYPIITWAGPIEIPRYDVDNNPFGYKKQLLHTVRTVTNPVTGEDEDDDVVVYYDSRGDAHVLMTEDDITRMFEYIQNEEAQIWAAIDTKQDELTAGSNIIIDKDPDTGVVTISATGSGAAYTAGANIQISPYNVISATDTTYSAGENITIDNNNVISATDTTYSAGQNITISSSNVISAIVDLSNYYNKAEVNQLISDLDSISMRVVATLPTTGVSNIIYLVQRTGETVYDQWIYSEGQWYHVGDTNIDLSEYYTKLETYSQTEADAKFQEILSEGNNIDPVTDSTELSSVDLSNKAVNKVSVSDLWDYMWKKIYPVGSIYISYSSTSPATLFGGTWTQISGRFLVASGSATYNYVNTSGSSATGTVNFSATNTGGSPRVQLTTDYMPKHSHGLPYRKCGSTTGTDWRTDPGVVEGYAGNTQTAGGGSYPTGNGEPFNNLPPYLVVYMWRRTS